MIPPKVWAQLKHAFVTIGGTYGVRIQVADEPTNVMALEQRWFDWVEEQAARGG